MELVWVWHNIIFIFISFVEDHFIEIMDDAHYFIEKMSKDS